jgi:tripartite-type tricarboxylate transporter receptor subunit TctC
MRKSLLVLVAAMSALLSAALYADDYPSRPVTIVNVFGPGGGSDTVCRIIANKLGPALGQPVIVEDRPGADGALAALSPHTRPTFGSAKPACW